MSDLPQQDTINQYVADGVTLSYVYSYLILLNTDITVYVTPSGQPPIPANDIKVLGVDYTVTGEGVPTGGTVVFFVAPPLGATVTLVRTIQASIITNFALAQNFNGANLDDAFERVTLVSQQTVTLFNERALQYETNAYLPNPNSNFVPVLPNGYVWSGLNGSVVATQIETNPDIGLLRSQLASESPLADGSTLVGYYDPVNASGSTLSKFLNSNDLFGYDTGVADALVLNIPNCNYTYGKGRMVKIIPAFNNLTTTPTINVNGMGAKLIKRNPTSAAQASDIRAGEVINLVFDTVTNAFYLNNIVTLVQTITLPTYQIFTTPGAHMYTRPIGCTRIIVEGVGAGGGSGGSPGGFSGIICASAGGGAGGYFKHQINSPLATYNFIIGQGGAGGNAAGTNGIAGTSTSFDTITATGGGGGAGVAATNTVRYPAGGLGGVGSGANILNSHGDDGGNAFCNQFVSGGYLAVAGFGGGNQMAGQTRAPTVTNPGLSAHDNGGGAAGALNIPISAGVVGGTGGNGKIIVTEFYD